MRSTVEVLKDFHLVRDGAAGLAEADFAALSDAAKLDALKDLQPLVWALQAQLTRLVGVVHSSAAVGVDGSSSTQSWMKGHLRTGDGGVQVRAAKALALTPEVAAVYARGECSPEHVNAVVAVIDDIPVEALAGGVDKLLAEQALLWEPNAFKRAAFQIRDHIDPDAAERRRRKRLDSRWVSAARTIDDVVSIQGMLDPDAGELFLSTLGALMPAPSLGDPRSASQRRADALLDLCRLAGAATPVAGGEKPHVSVTVDLDTLRADLDKQAHLGGGVLAGHTGLCAGAGCCDTSPDADGPFTADGRWVGARLGSGTWIGAETARRLACDCTLLPVVLGAAGEPLDVGRARRLVSPAQRRALAVRDGGCRWPGCDRPIGWTDAHHIRAWARGGGTDLRNLLLLCRHHHVRVHEGGFTIRLDHDTGDVYVNCPDGRAYDLIGRSRAHSP
jgi:hypothetical protein